MLTKKDPDGNFVNTIGEIKCTDANLAEAGTVATEGEFKGQFTGYPGGQCAFVSDEEDCDMESMIDFLEVYYCTF